MNSRERVERAIHFEEPDRLPFNFWMDRRRIYGGLYTGRIHMMVPEEIRAHVFERFEKAGPGGGLIVSSHDLDISTPEDQLDALVGAIKECTY